jgi:MATE family multidrug resistance protein
MLLFLFAARPLVLAFASGFGGSENILTLATIMLRLAALYTMADSAQIVFTGALRGAGDTRWVMRMSVLVHWIFTVIAIILIRIVHTNPLIVWIALIGFIIALGLVMFMRFRGGEWRQILVISDDEEKEYTERT